MECFKKKIEPIAETRWLTREAIDVQHFDNASPDRDRGVEGRSCFHESLIVMDSEISSYVTKDCSGLTKRFVE